MKNKYLFYCGLFLPVILNIGILISNIRLQIVEAFYAQMILRVVIGLLALSFLIFGFVKVWNKTNIIFLILLLFYGYLFVNNMWQSLKIYHALSDLIYHNNPL